MKEFNPPTTDSPEVMQQAVAAWMTSVVWDELPRVHVDEVEDTLVAIYRRIISAVSKTDGA